jgi:hypothetical protein
MTLFKIFMHYFVFKLLVILLSPLFLLLGMYLAWRIGFWAARKKLAAIINSMGEPTNAPSTDGDHAARREALPGVPLAPPAPEVPDHVARAQAADLRYELAHRAGLHLRAGQAP